MSNLGNRGRVWDLESGEVVNQFFLVSLVTERSKSMASVSCVPTTRSIGRRGVTRRLAVGLNQSWGGGSQYESDVLRKGQTKTKCRQTGRSKSEFVRRFDVKAQGAAASFVVARRAR